MIPKRRIHRTKWTNDSTDKLRELYDEGRKVSELAKLFGRTKSSVKSRLRTIGIYNCASDQPKPSDADSRDPLEIIAQDEAFQAALREAIESGLEKLPTPPRQEPHGFMPKVYVPTWVGSGCSSSASWLDGAWRD